MGILLRVLDRRTLVLNRSWLPISTTTVRRAVPEVLLQLSRVDDRPTAPAPFWVARVEDSSIPPLRVVEPEPRQTTPSMVKLSSRRRWVSILSAAAIVVGGFGVANLFALAP